tara:strand:+ start:3054 stop:3413 length:360 start_codon:yes stop_codon:yes gene_type:complete
MFQVAQQKPFGVTLTNGELPTTSPDAAPRYSETMSEQILGGNWYKDGYFNPGKDVQNFGGSRERPMLQWTEWNTDSADLSKTVITHGYDSNELQRVGLRPWKNQMFPRRVFDEITQEVL